MSFTILIASVPDRDDLVAEIWWGNTQVAELSRGAGGQVEIEIYPAASQRAWHFEFAQWLATLAEARRRLG